MLSEMSIIARSCSSIQFPARAVLHYWLDGRAQVFKRSTNYVNQPARVSRCASRRTAQTARSKPNDHHDPQPREAGAQIKTAPRPNINPQIISFRCSARLCCRGVAILFAEHRRQQRWGGRWLSYAPKGRTFRQQSQQFCLHHHHSAVKRSHLFAF